MDSKDYETHIQLNVDTVKAYLKICHGILLDEAEEAWVRGYSKAWLESYIEGKDQGEERAAKLMYALYMTEGEDAVQCAINDKEYRRRKYEEYKI